MKEAYTQGLQSEEDDDSIGYQIEPRDVGHNIYILAHQVRGRGGRLSSVLAVIKVGVMEYTLDLFFLKKNQFSRFRV